MSSLAEALPQEINRVRELQDAYKVLRMHPGIAGEIPIMMMETAISEGVKASSSGDVVRMIRAYEELKGFE